jgi:hypothetical protein
VFNFASGPSIVTSSMPNSTRALKAAPIAFWQSRQWQIRSLIGDASQA